MSKDNNPKVSIIIPVYNGSKYVNLAIDSALRQTYENKEIIVINDGSKDNTLKILNLYKDKVRVIDKENGGVSTALNLAIEEMTGDYFSWLSHDDLYYPEKVEKEVEYLKKNNLLGTKTIIYSDFDYIDGNGCHIYTARYNSADLNRESALPLQKVAINGLTLLIPKQAFIDSGNFDVNLRACQDYKLWFEMYKKDYKFIHIDEVLAVTRIHNASVSNTSPRVLSEGNEFWTNYMNYFNDEYKKKYYGSIYNYYYDFLMQFLEGPYDKAKELCTTNMEKIEKENDITKLKVSIVVPFKEITDTLFETIDSILKQTFKNIELILVNNGNIEINKKLDKIIKDNKNIKYITTKLLTKGMLYKQILNKVTGDYISFVKPTSILKKDKIKYQLTKMVSSTDKISHTSYDNKDKQLVDVGFKNGIVYKEILKKLRTNSSTFMYEIEFLKENIEKINDNLDDNDEDYMYLYLLDKNRLLGIEKSFVEEQVEIPKDIKIKNLLNIIIKLYDTKEIEEQIDYLLDLYSKNKTNNINDMHMEVIDRYRYMLTKEFRFMNKFKNKAKFHKLSNKKITNTKISKITKIIKKIIRK